MLSFQQYHLRQISHYCQINAKLIPKLCVAAKLENVMPNLKTRS